MLTTANVAAPSPTIAAINPNGTEAGIVTYPAAANSAATQIAALPHAIASASD
nr:hypothetical protein SY271_000204 [Bacillus thuringiensis]